MNLKIGKLFFLLLIRGAMSVNILYLHTTLSPSHFIWNQVLAKELAVRGHNVTFLSVNSPTTNRIENFHHVSIEGVYEIYYGEEKFDLMELTKFNKDNKLYSAFNIVIDFTMKGCRAVMKGRNGIENILNYPDDFKFDIVINDFAAGPCVLPIIHKFNYPPIVGVTPFLNPSYTTNSIGGHKYPAYVPFYIMNLPQLMNFYQRFYNYLLYWIEKV
jgi:glucuronosyltransferase